MNNKDHTLLLIEVPRTNDKKELSAEQMFAALHGILKPIKRGLFNTNLHLHQDYISFEIASIAKNIYFYIWLPTYLRNFVEGQIYAQYSTAQIFKVNQDYTAREFNHKIIRIVELGLIADDSLPIKTFPNFEVDPLSGITATLSRLESIEEEMWIQILTRPVDDEWHKRGKKFISKITSDPGLSLPNLIRAPFQSPDTNAEAGSSLSDRERNRIKAIEEKNNKLGYQIKIRLAYVGNDEIKAGLHMQALIGAFKQFNTTELNGFKQKTTSDNQFHEYKLRSFQDEGFVLNIEELASVFHLPHTSVDTPSIVWASSKTAEPPSILPTTHNHKEEEISTFGITNFRNTNLTFGSLRADRGRHVYIIGQTGTGKSGLLELLALSDMKYDHGYAIIDPHGDFAINNLNQIPLSKINDIIYLNPADSEFPIGFNPLEVTDSRQKTQIASDLVGVMKRMFDSWGPRLEYILRYTILALLDNPGTTMLDITRVLTNKNFRKKIISNVKDEVVLNFWQKEFNTWDNRFQTEAVAPVLNKVGAFTANPTIRNIIGQQKSSFDIRKIMDEGKILIVNLSRGLIGEDNANILGAMIITKIQLAAMSRADIANIEDRRPFYLYVDEFQNFATDSFAVILSEARKYALFLTLANQYISQMSEEVRSAVFGNVGTIISFRVSPDDAPFLEKYFDPQFNSSDIIQLANRNFITTMTIKGEKAFPFSGRTLQLPSNKENHLDQIINSSRSLYAKPKAETEKGIQHIINLANSQKNSASKESNPTSIKQQNKETDILNLDTADKRKPRQKVQGIEIPLVNKESTKIVTKNKNTNNETMQSQSINQNIPKSNKKSRKKRSNNKNAKK